MRLFLFYKILQHNLFSGNVNSCEDLCNNNAPYKNVEHFNVTDVNAFSWKQQEAMQMTCDFKTISSTFAKNKWLLATVSVIIFSISPPNDRGKKSGFLVEKQGLTATIIWPVFLL